MALNAFNGTWNSDEVSDVQDMAVSLQQACFQWLSNCAGQQKKDRSDCTTMKN